MKNIVLIAGTCFKEAAEAAAWFRTRGDTVYELPSPDADPAPALEAITREGRLDYLLIQATHRGENVQPLGQLDYQDMGRVFQQDLCGAHTLVEATLPLLRLGKKRLGLITSAATSIREPQEAHDFGFAMTQAALHMLWKLYFNKLRPEGFTFRCFCPNPDGSGLCAGEYMHMDMCYDPREEYIHSEENRLVLRDGHFREISW